MDFLTHPKTINVHTVTIDDDEIWEILKDPEPFLDQLRDRAMTTDGPATSRTVRKTKRVNSIKKKNARKSGSTRQKVSCPHCNRTVAAFMLARHISTAHPDQT